MASLALRLSPRHHHLRLLMSRLYSSATLQPQPESTPAPAPAPAPVSSDKISRLKADIRREFNPDRIASLFLSAGNDLRFHGDREIYSIAIRRLASPGRTDLIESLLSSALSSNPSHSEGFLIRILTLYARSGMMDHAVRTFNQIKSVTDRSFSALLSAFLENKQFDQLHKAFNTLPLELGFSPGIVSYNVFLKCLCAEGKLVTARAVLDEMPKKGIEPCIISYNTVLNGYLMKGDEPQFDEFLKLMYHKELRPDVVTFQLRIQLLCNKGRSTEAEEILQAMVLEKINPDKVIYNTIIEGFCKEGKVSSAFEVFKKFKEAKPMRGTSISPKTSNLLIKGLVEKELFLPAVELYKKCAREKKWTPSFQVVKGLVEGLLNISQKKAAEHVVRSMGKKVDRGAAKDEWKKIEASFSL